MKVVLTVHQFLPDFFAGTEIIALGIARELMQRGHEVTVVTGFPSRTALTGAKRFDSYVYENIRVERFWHSHAGAGAGENVVESDYDNPVFGRFFSDLLRELRPDVVHLARLSASAIGACARQKVPMIYTATDFWLVCPLHQLRLSDNSMCGGPNALSVNCVRHHMNVVQQVRESYRTLGEGAVHSDVLDSVQGVQQESLSRARRIPYWAFGLLVWALSKRLLPARGLGAKVRALSKRPAFMRRQMNRLDLVLAPSHIVRTMLVRNGLEARRVRLLPYGINTRAIARNTGRGDGPVLRVGFIGSLYEHKGPHLLIEAVRALPPEVALELRVFGRPDPGLASAPYYQSLQNLIGDDSRIVLCGPFPNEEIGRVLSGLDVLVVPSVWYENTPVVIYEALAAGCPVVATDIEGIAELVQHEENGLSVVQNSSATTIGNTRLEAADRAGDPITFTLTSVPAKGVLQLNGTTLTTGGTFTQADIDANSLTFTGTTRGTDSFHFIASNPAGEKTAEKTFALTITEIPSLVVTTNSDTSTNTDGLTSLREAINYASTGTFSSTPEITFDSSKVTGTITLNGNSLNITSSVTITGPGAGALTISGNNKSQVFSVSGGGFGLGFGSSSRNVAINGLTITQATGSAISNSSNLSLTGCTLSGNTTTGQGGGAINNYYGTLTMTGCTLSGNTASSGGAIYTNNIATLTGCTLSGNTATNGGAIYNNYGTATLSNSTLLNNSACARPSRATAGA